MTQNVYVPALSHGNRIMVCGCQISVKTGFKYYLFSIVILKPETWHLQPIVPNQIMLAYWVSVLNAVIVKMLIQGFLP